MDNQFEQIVPWNGANDTGRDVRLKWQRNFERVKAGLQELLAELETQGGALDEVIAELENFLRKDQPDSTPYLLTLLAGARFFRYVEGLAGGSGAAVVQDPETGKTYLEADGARLREELVVPKITFNCVDVVSGDKANTFAFGTIREADTEAMEATLDLLDGQLGTLHEGDICRGVFHNLAGGNDTEDGEDDANGFCRYAGFSTAYFTPTAILENAPGTMRFRYSLQPGTSVHPLPGMNFFAYGNFTDPARQSITYETRRYTRRLKDMDTWAIDPGRNISMQDGLLDGLTIGGMTMKGYGTFQENNYFTGTQIQFTPEQLEEFKGEDGYSVSLSSYERVVKTDAEGNIVSLTRSLNVVAADGNVVTGDRNVVTGIALLQTFIQAFRGATPLAFAAGAVPEEGTYVVTLRPVDCTASVSGGVVTVESIADGAESCHVELLVNCEGRAVVEKVFAVTIVRDGQDGKPGDKGESAVSFDLDNEMASVACDLTGAVVSGLPVETTARMWQEGRQLALTALDVYAPDGVTVLSDPSTGRVRVTAVGASVPDVAEVTVTGVVAASDGTMLSRSARLTLNKLRPGADGKTPVVYSLVVSPGAVCVDSAGQAKWTKAVTCRVLETVGGQSRQLEEFPDDADWKLSCYRNSTAGTPEEARVPRLDISVEGTHPETSAFLYFVLYRGGTAVDTETVPIVHDGMDGLGSVTVDADNETVSVAVDGSGSIAGGLPATVNFRMYYGTQPVELTSLQKVADSSSYTSLRVSTAVSGTVGTAVIDGGGLFTEQETLRFAVAGTLPDGSSHTGYAAVTVLPVSPGKDGKDAVIYQLLPSPGAVKKGHDYTARCSVTRNAAGKVDTISALPSGYRMTVQIDGGSETDIQPNRDVDVREAEDAVVFRLLDSSGQLLDLETLPVVADGKPGDQGDPGLAGCIVRDSEWALGTQYRNDEGLETTATRYLDVALVRDAATTTGWRAYKCLQTHTATDANAPGNTAYWQEFAQNVASIFTTLILAKNAKIQLLQGNQLLIQKADSTITIGLTGDYKGKAYIWAGGETPAQANFCVDEEGDFAGRTGWFSGFIRKNRVEVTADNFGSLFQSFLTDGSFCPDLTKVGGYVVFKYKPAQALSLPFAYATRTPFVDGYLDEYVRPYVGSDIVLHNQSGSAITVTGLLNDPSPDNVYTHGAVLQSGEILHARCRMTAVDGREAIFWEYEKMKSLWSS